LALQDLVEFSELLLAAAGLAIVSDCGLASYFSNQLPIVVFLMVKNNDFLKYVCELTPHTGEKIVVYAKRV
jgi:hypothetical protein